MKSTGFLFVLVISILSSNAQFRLIKRINVVSRPMEGVSQLPLVTNHIATSIYVDAAELKVVHIAAGFLASDIEKVTSVKPLIVQQSSKQTNLVIVSTVGKSSLLNQLVQSKKISVADVKGKWEAFKIVFVSNPLPNVKKAVCIIGSDDRGTAFGVLELSRMIGVHPFYWWADIEPEHKNELYVNDGTDGRAILQSPSVQYRGIFLNDEDWGLQPWAAKKMDTAIKDIGPRTYERIFELLLRLKANYIWPAMHPCTKAFYFYPENGKLAADYAIVVGTSHCEPMMRNNVFEWAENYKHEYGFEPREWRYDLNKEQIYAYWNDRIKAVKNYPTVTTMGMRGIHDGSMPGPKDMPGKVNLLQDIIRDQRSILFNNYQKPVEAIPQIFCPYKEVLNVYNAGLQLPDDITLVWSDDNHGYIRQLSNVAERKRSGGSGVYYHLSYWGRPADYLWLSTISPSLISYEMSKAYAFDARKLWVFNVGDIKPAEAEMQYAMEIAWDIDKADPEKSSAFTERWAAEIFGKENAPAIAFIKNKYYEMAAAGKPEHLLKLSYRDAEADNRLQHYQSIAQQAIALHNMIPERLKDAYFQLVLYPVVSAMLMNEKILYAKQSIALAQTGNSLALQYSSKSRSAFDSIVLLTDQYNQQIAKGKWNGMMSWHPRDLEVFRVPKVADEIMLKQLNGNQPPTRNTDTVFLTYVSAGNFDRKKDVNQQKVTIFKGLGIDANGIGVLPFATVSTSTKDIDQLPYAEYNIDLKKGSFLIQLNCLPTHDVNKESKLSIGVSFNSRQPVFFDIEAPADTAPWDKNVIQGFVRNQLPLELQQGGKVNIKVYFPSSGVVLNTINIVQVANPK